LLAEGRCQAHGLRPDLARPDLARANGKGVASEAVHAPK